MMRDSARSPDARGPATSERRRAVRRELERIEPGLRVVAEDVLAHASRIDLVGIDRRRRITAVTIAPTDGEAPALTRVLAHRAWLAAHAGDWLKLAPDLGLDPGAPVRSILVAPTFDRETRAAAEELPEGWVELLRSVELGEGDQRQLGLAPVAREAPDAPRDPAHRGDGSAIPTFRSGLRPEDLALSDPEASHFD